MGPPTAASADPALTTPIWANHPVFSSKASEAPRFLLPASPLPLASPRSPGNPVLTFHPFLSRPLRVAFVTSRRTGAPTLALTTTPPHQMLSEINYPPTSCPHVFHWSPVQPRGCQCVSKRPVEGESAEKMGLCSARGAQVKPLLSAFLPRPVREPAAYKRCQGDMDVLRAMVWTPEPSGAQRNPAGAVGGNGGRAQKQRKGP